MKRYDLMEQGDTALTECADGAYYLASEADAKIKEYDDDNLALSQSVVKLGARIAELESDKEFLATKLARLREVLDARTHSELMGSSSND